MSSLLMMISENVGHFEQNLNNVIMALLYAVLLQVCHKIQIWSGLSKISDDVLQIYQQTESKSKKK